MTKSPLIIKLASPRGFCAGVDRAIQIVERALEIHGAPVYVRHEIVHNAHVVSRLKAMGAVFVEELSECPDDRPVVFSAHGVPKSVPHEAEARQMTYLDATCPLVSKVHVEAQRHFDNGYHILLVGHAGHPEVVGTMGQLPTGAITLIETIDDARTITPEDPSKLAYASQTTLSVDDTSEIIKVLNHRFPSMVAPFKEDICYATTNRQEAVKAIAADCDLVWVIGSSNSSNSQRLVEVALKAGAKKAALIDGPTQLDWGELTDIKCLGLTAGASAPEELVEGVIEASMKRFEVKLQHMPVKEENVSFKLPRSLMMKAS